MMSPVIYRKKNASELRKILQFRRLSRQRRRKQGRKRSTEASGASSPDTNNGGALFLLFLLNNHFKAASVKVDRVDKARPETYSAMGDLVMSGSADVVSVRQHVIQPLMVSVSSKGSRHPKVSMVALLEYEKQNELNQNRQAGIHGTRMNVLNNSAKHQILLLVMIFDK
ncbi:unnamed protein product [Mytilus edulis]|uniref:Uncharacterized protein n=1 Tax=Mytilus edulis TaxID=6550 RepID=A0A8S3STL8_MYTED|nr:unnamed protein product [Mytilus edulis]